MAKIDDITERRIKDAANIMDVITEDLGVKLHRCGSEYSGLCPFHADKHEGSFKVSEAKNIATCFSCGKTWNPIDALMEGLKMDYPTALRHLAARYHIYIDEEPVPVVTPAKPREAKVEQKPIIWWQPKVLVKPYIGHAEKNPLLQYLYALPLKDEHKEMLRFMAEEAYFVGTYPNGSMEGWTIWWQIDDENRVRTGKLMAYKADGHRNKDLKYSFNFVHAMLAKAGKWDKEKYDYKSCLFGLHLVDTCPDAEICIVESEKSALICSAFCDPNKRLWMATAGKSQLTRKQLEPLIKRNRYIVLYPDFDGYDEWEAAMKRIDYPRMSISQQVKKYHIMRDGDKADMADIMLRLVSGVEETLAERVARKLHADDKVETLDYMIKKLNLEEVR